MDRVVERFLSLFLWSLTLLMNLFIQAATRIFFRYEENRKFPGTIREVLMGVFVFRFASKTSASSGLARVLGQNSSGSFNHSGPSHQRDFNNCLGEQPREGRSAGFISPGTCTHSLFPISFRISRTRFPTNEPQSSLRWIQAIATDESLQ